MAGLVWRRAAPTLRIRDPHKDEKMAVIHKALDECSAEHPVFYEDEVDIHLNPKIGADWQLRGQQNRVVTPGQNEKYGTVAKLAMRQPFVLFKGLTFQKLCLPGAFRPGDHHNKMLRPGLCVVHASPQYL